MAKRIILIALICALICSAASALTELCFVNVGKGDAILLKSDSYAALIDTGKKKAQDQILRAMEAMNIDHLNAVIITHCDDDHTGGLKWLQKSDLPIDAIYASAFHPETKPDKHPAIKAADKLGVPFSYLKAGDELPAGNGVLRVLAPISAIPGKEDNNSLVLLLDSPDGRALLCGDMELIEEEALLNSRADVACDIIKIPNHGDDDACGSALIAAAQPQLAIISTSTADKPDTPSDRVLTLLKNANIPTHVTQDYDIGALVTLSSAVRLTTLAAAPVRDGRSE